MIHRQAKKNILTSYVVYHNVFKLQFGLKSGSYYKNISQQRLMSLIRPLQGSNSSNNTNVPQPPPLPPSVNSNKNNANVPPPPPPPPSTRSLLSSDLLSAIKNKEIKLKNKDERKVSQKTNSQAVLNLQKILERRKVIQEEEEEDDSNSDSDSDEDDSDSFVENPIFTQIKNSSKSIVLDHNEMLDKINNTNEYDEESLKRYVNNPRKWNEEKYNIFKYLTKVSSVSVTKYFDELEVNNNIKEILKRFSNNYIHLVFYNQENWNRSDILYSIVQISKDLRNTINSQNTSVNDNELFSDTFNFVGNLLGQSNSNEKTNITLGIYETLQKITSTCTKRVSNAKFCNNVFYQKIIGIILAYSDSVGVNNIEEYKVIVYSLLIGIIFYIIKFGTILINTGVNTETINVSSQTNTNTNTQRTSLFNPSNQKINKMLQEKVKTDDLEEENDDEWKFGKNKI